MKKNIKAVITPDDYANAQTLPVVYLLHGYSGNYSDRVTKAAGFEKAVDLYQIIIVCLMEITVGIGIVRSIPVLDTSA